jgi:hypothetical protein
MEAFEKLVGGLLERDGYWVKFAFKVELSKREKRLIGRPSSPRWELDIIAYKAAINELLVVECKSYLDSPGVRFAAVSTDQHRRSDRYKLFNDHRLRGVVFKRLEKQLVERKACRITPSIILCLAAGRIVSEPDRERLRKYFRRCKWKLFDDEWVRTELSRATQSGYEDDVATVVAKLLLSTRRRSPVNKQEED